jgi:hypothetical protein
MNTAHFSHARSLHPRPDRDRAAEVRDALLVVSGVLAAAVVLFTGALVSDRLQFNDAVTLEPATAVASMPQADDASRRQKPDAPADDLPAQF